ncbi:MAG: SDR family NAD(P)-dependent oxidoreductase [Dehalococcoidia bacterium]
MKNFSGKLAVVTGGGSGMGRELTVQLAAAGCSVATCDIIPDTVEATAELARKSAPEGTTVTSHVCDVSRETEVLSFRDEVREQHPRGHINLLFNNAGIGGGGSFVSDSREDWEKTFAVSWYGVYYCTRAFLPLLLASDEGHLVNTSSVNGFWASLGPGRPHTAYSSAKFAIKGFSEALITDFRMNAPHLKVSVVMPGHIGTNIAINSGRILGHPDPLDLPDDEVEQVRADMKNRGLDLGPLTNDQIRGMLKQMGIDFREQAPVTAAQAASVILEGVRDERWRILVGDDADELDRRVRADPEEAYEESFSGLTITGPAGD